MTSEQIFTVGDLPDEVVEAIRRGRKIEAIKILRERCGLGLAHAKVLVDRAWNDYGPVRPKPSFADPPADLAILGKVLASLLITAIAWYVYFGT